MVHYGDIDGPIHSAMRRSQFDQAGGQWSRTNPALKTLGVAGYRRQVGGSWVDMLKHFASVSPAPTALGALQGHYAEEMQWRPLGSCCNSLVGYVYG